MIRFTVAVSLLILVTIFAFWRGGRPERTAATILVSILVTDQIYHNVFGAVGVYREVDPVHAAIDGVALVAMVWLALGRDRVWTLWFAGFQVIAAMSHVVRATDVEMYPIVYAIIIRGPFWVQILLVGLGTWLHVRRQRGDAQTAEEGPRAYPPLP